MCVWSKIDPEYHNVLALRAYFLDLRDFREAWIITPWQENRDLAKYLADTQPDEKMRLELVWLLQFIDRSSVYYHA